MTRPKGVFINQARTKRFKTFKFDGIYKEVFGTPETNGIWLIYGKEKHGKTTLCLLLAELLSTYARAMYISGEEGISAAFVNAIDRAKLKSNNRRLIFHEYLEIPELENILNKRQSPNVVFFDNMTIYNDDLKNGVLKSLVQKYPNKLFVIIAHEERNEPYTATAKLARKLASIIIRVEGLACSVFGRCPGGNLIIDEEKATLYHGTEILN